MLAPPRPSSPPDELEALIREARARQQRRRIGIALAVLAVATAAVAGGAIVGSSARPPTAATGHRPFAALRAFSGRGRLAFVSRGRLFVLDGEAGRLVRVSGRGASAPAFSPDGRWLSYVLHGRAGVAWAEGTHAQLLPVKAAPSWLPGGELLAGRAIYRMDDGAPVRVGTAPAGLVAWAPDGSRYAFVASRVTPKKSGSAHGVELLQVASSLRGPRTTWYRLHEAFAPQSGWQSSAFSRVVVLPRGRGLLFWLDPLHSASIAADGLPVFELASRGARPRRLGVAVGGGVSVAAGGRFALGGGGDRFAWVTKRVVTCSRSRCASPPAGEHELTLDPAWSPNGKTLAYVAAQSERPSNFFQPTIRRWYATRRLRLLRAGGTAVEIPRTDGAAAPKWSRDGRSLLFVKGDSVWLLPRLGAKPLLVAGPLFTPDFWPSYYGQIDWSDQLAWWSAR